MEGQNLLELGLGYFSAPPAGASDLFCAGQVGGPTLQADRLAAFRAFKDELKGIVHAVRLADYNPGQRYVQ